jgi:mono/diheme cytochrome c family protein
VDRRPRHRARAAGFTAAATLVLGAALVAGQTAGSGGAARAATGDAARGEYVLRAGGCAACHTQAEEAGPPLAGGRPLETPFGTFYAPNITPHPEHGIGRWSAEDLWRALREGEGPGAVHYYPVFPYPSYAAMRREDSDALHGYLMGVEPQAVPNREHDLPWYLRWRVAARIWKWLFLDTEPFTPRADKSGEWNRGAYLVTALGHCGECHSPRNLLGVVERDRHLAGNPDGPEGSAVPSIRSDTEEGIASWSVKEVMEYLKSGMDPDFDFAGGAMAEVIEDNTEHLTDADRRAIAVYLKDLPAL